MLTFEIAVTTGSRARGTQRSFHRAPEEISAVLLKELMHMSSKRFKDNPPIKAVVTVPAYFTLAQRIATRHSARIAELDVLHFMDEPSAAALTYA